MSSKQNTCMHLRKLSKLLIMLKSFLEGKKMQFIKELIINYCQFKYNVLWFQKTK